jgi:hypothetical protein
MEQQQVILIQHMPMLEPMVPIHIVETGMQVMVQIKAIPILSIQALVLAYKHVDC